MFGVLCSASVSHFGLILRFVAFPVTFGRFNVEHKNIVTLVKTARKTATETKNFIGHQKSKKSNIGFHAMRACGSLSLYFSLLIIAAFAGHITQQSATRTLFSYFVYYFSTHFRFIKTRFIIINKKN